MSDIVYSWEFGSLEVIYNQEGMTNIIKTVHWEYVAILDGTSKRIINSLPLPSPSAESFVPFNLVTKEMVTDWVIDKIGGITIVQNMQNQLSSSIALELAPLQGVVSPPWE